MKVITGGCLCKQVRYEFTAEPIAMRLCWCRDCQYLANGNATVNVIFPSESLRITGELRDYQSTADSGNPLLVTASAVKPPAGSRQSSTG